MQDFTHQDDVILCSLARVRAIRALLAGRTWRHLSSLSVTERDRALDAMAIREYRAEELIHPPE